MAVRSVLALSALFFVVPATAQTTSTINRIIDEGMNRSQVMLTAHELMDGIGARLTNSPRMREAEDWAEAKFGEWGLSNVRREGFEFGRGWSIESSSVRMVAPRPLDLTAIPIAWTPPTQGTLRAEIVMAPMSEEEHFDAYRGQLAGKIVLVSLPGEGSEPSRAPFRRLTSEQLRELDEFRQPDYDPEAIELSIERRQFSRRMDAFLAAEGAAAWARIARRDGKLLHGEGYTHRVGETPSLPGIEIAAEDYRRLARLARTGPAPVLEMNNNVRFHDDNTQAYNIIAEIPGTDRNAGYVMAGAHFDGWAGGDGAVDNGAGSVAVMEAARILRTLGIRPKRTIRFVLWGAEEQGLLGSLAYVERYLATRPRNPEDDAFTNYLRWRTSYPITRQPGYDDLKAYFNIDNGSGKLRGVYAEGNYAAVSMLREWLTPFNSMGASTVVAAPTGGADHVFMQSVGVPGFQFIQDPLDYGSRLHHTNIDTLDHVKAEDLRQASVVLAGMLVQAANADETLPRPPLPTQPLDTDPFDYRYPDGETE